MRPLTFRHAKKKKPLIIDDPSLTWEELLVLEPELNRQGYFIDLAAPRIVSGVGGVGRNTDDQWKDILKSIKKNAGKNNTINV